MHVYSCTAVCYSVSVLVLYNVVFQNFECLSAGQTTGELGQFGEVHVHVHVRTYVVLQLHVPVKSVIETRQCKATTPEDNSFQKTELPQAGLEPGYCTILPADPLRQPSWAGRILKFKQRQRCLYPDKQGTSNPVYCTCMYMYKHLYSYMYMH